jgi:Cache domain
MPFEATELRISLQKLLIGLVLVIVPLSVVGLYITHRSDQSLEQTIGAQHRAVAESISHTINQFMNDRVTDCRVIANEPSVLEAIAASNKSHKSMGDAALKDQIDRIRKNWNVAESEPALKAILTLPASRVLRGHHEIDPRYLRITVADETGVTVAATDKPVDYLQAEESYWPAVYAAGRGAVTVRNVLYDAASRSHYIGIAVPVPAEDTHEFIGAVYTLVDIGGLLRQFEGEQMSSTAKIILTKGDGTLIMAPGVTLANGLKSEEYTAVRDPLANLRGRQTGYVMTDLFNGRRNIVGFADTGPQQDDRSLGWIVMVSQDMREATAPVRGVGSFASAMVILGLLMLTITGVYVLLHRREEFEEIEPLGRNLPPKVAST